jgi:phosphatidylethanolamine-binding protein (PEBP) family uncharacterized protein
MVTRRNLTILSAVLLSVAITACGSSGTPAINREPEILFLSPALAAGRVIPARYQCDESKVWIPLRWGALPADTKELVIYIARYGALVKNPNGGESARLLAQSLVVGLKPTLHGLAVGKLPSGVLVGTYNAGGTESQLCPRKKHVRQDFLFRLYALPNKQNITSGSKRGEILDILNNEAVAAGAFTASYTRT